MANRSLPISAAWLALAASLGAAAADAYKISASLLHNGEPFGEPTVVVKADTPATVTVTGPDGYEVSFTVSDLAPDKLQVRRMVHCHLFSSRGRGSQQPLRSATSGSPSRCSEAESDHALQRTGEVTPFNQSLRPAPSRNTALSSWGQSAGNT